VSQRRITNVQKTRTPTATRFILLSVNFDVLFQNCSTSYSCHVCQLSTLSSEQLLLLCTLDLSDRPGPALCSMPYQSGSCDHTHVRYYYDAGERTCKQFNYTGCLGNDNNFLNFVDCMTVCGGYSTRHTSTSFLPV